MTDDRRRSVLGTTLIAASILMAVAVVALMSRPSVEIADPGRLQQPIIDPGDNGSYSVFVDPAEFSAVVDNPWSPKLPGMVWVYETTGSDGNIESVRVEVLDETRQIMGVETIVVHDVVTDGNGRLVEDTYDWFAQDSQGNVWYFGEDTTAYDEDGTSSEAGAWEAGVDGALPGIVMWAAPSIERGGYRQEFYRDEAEDMGQVIATSGSVSVPYGDFATVIVTRDWTPLEPRSIEEKTYARGVGFVSETKDSEEGTESVVLVDFRSSY